MRKQQKRMLIIKKSTQHRWHIFRCNGFNSFNRKISYSFIGIYLLYYLLNRYYKCCRMLKMVLTGCCRVLKNVERVLNGVGMIKCAKWTCCSCWKRWTAFRNKWTISQRHEKCRPLSERHRIGEADVIHPRWWDHRPHRGWLRTARRSYHNRSNKLGRAPTP